MNRGKINLVLGLIILAIGLFAGVSGDAESARFLLTVATIYVVASSIHSCLDDLEKKQ